MEMRNAEYLDACAKCTKEVKIICLIKIWLNILN